MANEVLWWRSLTGARNTQFDGMPLVGYSGWASPKIGPSGVRRLVAIQLARCFALGGDLAKANACRSLGRVSRDHARDVESRAHS